MKVPLLQAEGIRKGYRSGGRWPQRARVISVAGVDLHLAEGESVGLVGESGSGKTTLARIIAGMIAADAGRLRWRGRSVAELDPAERALFRRQVQYVFQNPVGSLNPRHRVGRILDDTLRGLTRLRTSARRGRIAEIARQLGLDGALLRRFPHQLSGGQAQRVAIARALLGRTQLVILDEPVSALDVSLQAQILNLLEELRASQGLGYLLISHDLAVVERLCERVVVMRDGAIVEQGARQQVLREPRTAYTRRLLAAVPTLDVS
jgi:peptide/nickel transport system ATP-binding protein